VSKPRKSRKVKPWTVEKAQQFLASAREADDSLYAAFVLILVLGLRRGEVLGLAWELVDLDQAELFVGEQLQRVNHKILRRETKTEASEAPLPPPAICVAALKLRKEQQNAARRAHSERWTDTGLVFTTRYGTPIEPHSALLRIAASLSSWSSRRCPRIGSPVRFGASGPVRGLRSAR
jgi:integrase